MNLTPRIARLVALILLGTPAPRAQTTADLSGHWEGTVDRPGTSIAFQVDFTKTSSGDLTGTISIPAQHVKGLPLTKVAIEGTSVTFGVRSDQLLTGVIAGDGKSMSGTFNVDSSSIPFSIARTGDARIEAPVRNASIAKEFEGIWNATLDVAGGLHLVLTLSNQADGTSTGVIVNLDEGKLVIPASAIRQTDSSLTLEFSAIEGSFRGTLNKEGTELVGTFSEGALSGPLTFRRPN